jgi:DNA polymerase
MESKNYESLLSCHKQILKCTKCSIAKSRTKAVPGEGSFQANLILIGEGPGREEDLQGRPFVGRAGKLLDRLISKIKLAREDIFITNIIKCRPIIDGKDRRPTPSEIIACTPYLVKQLEEIKPRVIGTLGDTATRYLFKRYNLIPSSLSIMHGKPSRINELILYPMYHPAAALYNPNLMNTLFNDFNILNKILNELNNKIASTTLDQFLKKKK